METTAPPYDIGSEPLLLTIKSRHSEPAALLERVSSHWYFEDGFYQAYHQIWKLFGLQTDTLVVTALRALWPERHFHSWFVQIVREGTGLEFSFADNRDWLRKGRPILEAFFHAAPCWNWPLGMGMSWTHAPRVRCQAVARLLELFSGPEPGADPPPEQEIVPAREERFRL